MKNKSRIAWFSIFYVILFLFAIYNLVFLVIIWDNHELRDLYTEGFIATGNNGQTMLTYSNAFAIYGLVTIGTILSFFGILGAVLSQLLVTVSDTPRKKLVGLITAFVVVIIGFYFGFIAQLFYYQWDNQSVIIQKPGSPPVSADYFYKNWFNIIEIWVLFALFIILLILSIFLILKLHQKNIDFTRYIRANTKEELNLEITAPFPSSGEFDPNETQTITLNLDPTDKIMSWKKKKKKQKKTKKNK